MKVLHIITALTDGGAEGVLYRLCKYDDKAKHIVVSMMDGDKYGPLLSEVGIEVHCLNMPQGRISFTSLWKLFQLIRRINPDVVQTWMYHADLIGGLIAKFAGVKNIFWNVRRTNLENRKSRPSRFFVAKACALFSTWIPKNIVYCAQKAKEVHENFGYKQSIGIVVGNGYDLSLFYPFNVPRNQISPTVEINDLAFCIGFVGRYAPEKDHRNLFHALSILKKKCVKCYCLLVGRGMDESNPELMCLLQEKDLIEDVLLLGQVTDIPSILNVLDLHVLSSYSEGFPNVLAEAMACGTPCVTTDVGDASLILGETGWVVPPGDAEALSDAIMEAIKEKQQNPQAWLNRKISCRSYIVEHFSVDKMINSYHQVWLN
jgi:glycosyltransferase involved in cell wall biosynthesis